MSIPLHEIKRRHQSLLWAWLAGCSLEEAMEVSGWRVETIERTFSLYDYEAGRTRFRMSKEFRDE